MELHHGQEWQADERSWCAYAYEHKNAHAVTKYAINI